MDSRNLCKTTGRVRVAATIMIFGLGIAGLSSAIGGPTQAVRGSDRAVGAEHANRDLRPRIPGPYADAGLPDPDWTKNGQFSIASDSIVRHGTDGRVVWAKYLGGELGGVRPPHILADSERVYVAGDDGVTALSTQTGDVVWHSRGPKERMLLSTELLIATECGSSKALEANGHWVTARAVADGREVFKLRLPAELNDPLPIWEFGGLFVVEDEDRAVLIGRDGRLRHQLDNTVLGGVRLGDDVVLLMGGKVARLAPSGTPRWSIPSSGVDTDDGGIVSLPDGDLVEYDFGVVSDSGVSLKRFDPSDGATRWETFCRPLGVAHKSYLHFATVVLDADQLKVISRGSYGSFVEWLDPSTGRHIRRTQSK